MENNKCCGPVKKSDHCQSNIKCEVTNCVYHSKDGLCEAAQIEVGPGFAESSRETNCNTFRQK